MSYIRSLFRSLLRHRDRTKETTARYKPVVLVTGCSAGLGLALAELLYTQDDYRVVITAREKSLQALKLHLPEKEYFLVLPLDVTHEADRIRLYQDIETRWGGVDILVNNAGISYRSVIEHMTEKDEELQMATNYFGPMGLIRLSLPYMRATGRGKIINISSVSGMLAMPTMASYTASKFALEGASEALWYEMRPFGVKITLVQPGFVHSNSFKNVYYTPFSKPSENIEGPYCDFYENMSPFVEKMMNRSISTPQKVAHQVLGVIRTQDPPLWLPVTLDAKVFYYIRRLLPRRLLLPFLFWCLPNAHTWSRRYSHRREAR